jgi:hypothetical protein
MIPAALMPPGAMVPLFVNVDVDATLSVPPDGPV